MFVFYCQNCSVLIALGIKKGVGGVGGQQVTDGTISQVCAVRLVFLLASFRSNSCV